LAARNFATPGYAKAAWNFLLSPQADGGTRLVTETRVYCLDNASRRLFRRYWFFIKPFSGWIRKEALRAIKRKAENAMSQGYARREQKRQRAKNDFVKSQAGDC
jgi:hypothetical protein